MHTINTWYFMILCVFFSSQKYKEDICAKKQSNHDTKLFLISWNLLGVYKPYPTYPSL